MGIIFHIDVNSAYLSWTAVKMLKEGSRVDIREMPAIIGGNRETRHGVVLAKSIAAKKTGVTTGEPIASALKKCPNLMIVPPEHHYYQEQSRKLMALLREFTPDIEQVSVDECYMDFSGIAHRFASPIQAAYQIKDMVKTQLGFTVNIGISDVKVLAKMASDFEKPDKVHTLYRREIQQKMWPLPVEDLFMAGHSSVDTLHKLGIFTIGQLAQSPVDILASHLKSHGRVLWEYANGMDESSVHVEQEEAKGVGNSTTLPYDLERQEDIEKILLQLSEKVGERLRKAGQMAKTVAVEVKYNDFTKSSRQTTLDRATDSGTEIYNLSKILFEELWKHRPVRLLGVRTANLIEQGTPEQMSILDMLQGDGMTEPMMLLQNKTGQSGDRSPVSGKDADKREMVRRQPSREKMKKLDQAMDAIKQKYGKDAVSRASLMKMTSQEELWQQEKEPR